MNALILNLGLNVIAAAKENRNWYCGHGDCVGQFIDADKNPNFLKDRTQHRAARPAVMTWRQARGWMGSNFAQGGIALSVYGWSQLA